MPFGTSGVVNASSVPLIVPAAWAASSVPFSTFIIGETTDGGAHPTRMVSLDEGFVLAVPHAASISPITHGNWEGTGVVPDVATSTDAALDEALKQALKR